MQSIAPARATQRPAPFRATDGRAFDAIVAIAAYLARSARAADQLHDVFLRGALRYSLDGALAYVERFYPGGHRTLQRVAVARNIAQRMTRGRR